MANSGADVINFQLSGNLIKDIKELHKLNADVYHITGEVNYLALLLPWNKTFITVHDLGNYLFGLKGFKRQIYKLLWFSVPLRIARGISAISDCTKNELVNHIGIRSNRITVIQNCYSQIFTESPKPFNNDNPRILQIGTSQHKNAVNVARALKGLNCTLVIIGRIDKTLGQALKDNEIDFINFIDINQEEIFRQYLDSDIVSFISFKEGFGVPVIEAQAIGRALITSNIPPMSDNAGSGAYLADPGDIEHIKRGFTKIINDSRFRDSIIAEGIKNSKRYNPTRVAKLYMDLYTTAFQLKSSQ